MKFEEFQDACKHMHYGAVEDSRTKFEEKCHHPEVFKRVRSWGKCDKEHCPYFRKN